MLPLKLAPFERTMYIDDRELHPMAFHIRLRFSGSFDVEAFRQAVGEAVARHPLLLARVQGDDSLNLQWVESPQREVFVDVAPLGQPMRYPAGRERIDLTQENGLRVWARHGDGEVQMNFQFHHCCGDGIGAYRVIEDILAIYDQQLRGGQEAAQLRPLDPERLRWRTALGLPWWRRCLRVGQELWGLLIGIFLFFHIRPTDLPTPEQPQLSTEDAQQVLDMPAHTFTPEQYGALRDAARRAKATVNDILMRDTLLAMHQWVVRLEPQLTQRYLRLMIPVNLRGRRDDDMPCANVVGMVFLDRKLPRYKTPARLLTGIKVESGFLKFFRMAMSYPRVCQVLPWILGSSGVKSLADSPRCFATGALSNMGRVFYGHKLRERDGKIAAGEMTLECVESAPPVRNHSSTSLTALTYNGRLTIVLNYDRRHFTPEAAQQVLDAIVAAHQQTIAEAQTSDASRRPEKALVDR
jgi:hypothetical protein